MQRSLNPFNPRTWHGWRRTPPDAQAAQQARIDAKLRAIERQGSGGVHFGHALAYLLVFTFSVGALIALAGDALRTFIAQAQQGAMDIPSLISFVVSFVLVFAMDTAMVRAAATVRMLNQRHQEGARVHVGVIVIVCIVESATYLYMSYEYDHPGTQVVVWTILAVRAIIAPVVAVYLSLGRQMPVSARDINTQVEVVTGRGVLMDMTRIAEDGRATTERKVALYRASAIMDGADAQRLDAIIEAERATRAAAAATDGRDLAGIAALPARHLDQPQPSTPAALPQRSRSPHDARRNALAASMYTPLEEYEPDAAGPAEDDQDDGLDDEDDWGVAYTRQPHVTRPRANMSQRAAARHGETAARMEPRFSEMVIDLPEGKTARREDTPEARRVMNYLDRHQGSTIPEVMKGARVRKPTARRHYSVWVERNSKRTGMPAAPLTQEMPAILGGSALESLEPDGAFIEQA
jgi:hypothetical protein